MRHFFAPVLLVCATRSTTTPSLHVSAAARSRQRQKLWANGSKTLCDSLGRRGRRSACCHQPVELLESSTSDVARARRTPNALQSVRACAPTVFARRVARLTLYM